MVLDVWSFLKVAVNSQKTQHEICFSIGKRSFVNNESLSMLLQNCFKSFNIMLLW
jgi:hypothetical protein